MRLNFEDADFSSPELKKFCKLLQKSNIEIDVDIQAIGCLSVLWYHAVNKLKRSLTVAEINDYLQIYDLEKAKELAEMLCSAGFLVFESGSYHVIGKDKDYDFKAAKNKQVELMNKARLDKILRSDDAVSVQSSVQKSTQRPTKTSAQSRRRHDDVSVPTPIALHSSTDQNTPVQINPEQNNPPDGELTVIDAGLVEVDVRILNEPEQVKQGIFDIHRELLGYDPLEWTDKDYSNCSRIALRKLKTIRIVLEYYRFYLTWDNPKVIEAGYPFSDGYLSFCGTITQLDADIKNPRRRLSAKVLEERRKSNLKRLAEDIKHKEQIASAMRYHEERQKGFS